jgi:hypothetical protein
MPQVALKLWVSCQPGIHTGCLLLPRGRALSLDTQQLPSRLPKSICSGGIPCGSRPTLLWELDPGTIRAIAPSTLPGLATGDWIGAASPHSARRGRTVASIARLPKASSGETSGSGRRGSYGPLPMPAMSGLLVASAPNWCGGSALDGTGSETANKAALDDQREYEDWHCDERPCRSKRTPRNVHVANVRQGGDRCGDSFGVC